MASILSGPTQNRTLGPYLAAMHRMLIPGGAEAARAWRNLRPWATIAGAGACLVPPCWKQSSAPTTHCASEQPRPNVSAAAMWRCTSASTWRHEDRRSGGRIDMRTTMWRCTSASTCGTRTGGRTGTQRGVLRVGAAHPKRQRGHVEPHERGHRRAGARTGTALPHAGSDRQAGGRTERASCWVDRQTARPHAGCKRLRTFLGGGGGQDQIRDKCHNVLANVRAIQHGP
jgi:hypothetical protein